MEMNKILKQELVNWRDLTWLQTDSFKKLSPESLNKLKTSLSKNGFIQPFNVWYDAETRTQYILDGHHRRLAMTELEESGERIFPDELPANFINCKNRKEAVEFLLLYSSQYAVATKDGLIQMLELEEISISDISEEIDIQGLDLTEQEFEFSDSSEDTYIEPEELSGSVKMEDSVLLCRKDNSGNILSEKFMCQIDSIDSIEIAVEIERLCKKLFKKDKTLSIVINGIDETNLWRK